MKNLKNRVHLIGHLGADPEVKVFTSRNDEPRTLAKFSLATSESYRNQQGERVTDTQWHNVVAWGRVGEIAGQYLQKGRQVAVEGKLTYRHYDDNQGVRRYVTEVVIDDLLLLGTPSTEARPDREAVTA
ncbi:MAG: single-stranded DNA-binding protein [Catalinimonas sp.]